jgi:hypothetical protein
MQQLGLAVPASVQPSAVPGPAPVNVGGVLQMRSLAQTLARDAANQPQAPAVAPAVIDNLAAQIRSHWSIAKQAKLTIEQDMLSAVRSRRGEYDPDKLTKIKSGGGSEIYMMLFATKARQAKALLTDVFIGSGTEKPWSLTPTPNPELPPEDVSQIVKGVAQMVYQAEMAGAAMSVDAIRQVMQDARDRAESQMGELARQEAARAERSIEDVLVEGSWSEALDEFLDDLTTFKTAFLKGPVVRNVPVLTWAPGEGGRSKPIVVTKPKRQWERVDPFRMYPAPWAKSVNDAFLIERHQLERGELSALIGVEGYNEENIRAVLAAYGTGGLREWLQIDAEKATAEGRDTAPLSLMGSDLIDALQYWGSVSGKMLRQWGMDESQVPDEAKEYQVEAWLVGSWVIKAVVNPDPLGRRPYYADGFSRVPGAFWHNCLFDLVRDCQDMCNSAARALANNLGIASGPQVDVNVQRLAQGETITSMYPWKIWQTTSDPMGSTAKAINFFQPDSHAQELMAVYEKFSMMADEYSGIPRYMTGTEGTPGAGRTASGLSMMIGNASKITKQLISSIDMRVIGPSVEREYEHQIQFNADMRGDLNIVARGAMSLTAKEAAQVRRTEFLARTANPIDLQIMGVEGRAAVLRQVAKSLDMDTDSVVPAPSTLRLRQIQMGAMQQQPDPSGEQLQDGSPVSDHFSPTPA